MAQKGSKAVDASGRGNIVKQTSISSFFHRNNGSKSNPTDVSVDRTSKSLEQETQVDNSEREVVVEASVPVSVEIPRSKEKKSKKTSASPSKIVESKVSVSPDRKERPPSPSKTAAMEEGLNESTVNLTKTKRRRLRKVGEKPLSPILGETTDMQQVGNLPDVEPDAALAPAVQYKRRGSNSPQDKKKMNLGGVKTEETATPAVIPASAVPATATAGIADAGIEALQTMVEKSEASESSRSEAGEEEEVDNSAIRVKVKKKAAVRKDKKPTAGVSKDKEAGLVKMTEFDPSAAATWKKGESVPFSFLAQALEDISVESSRLAMTQILCNVFRTIIAMSPDDLLPVVYLSANRIAPPHEGVELGIGDASIIRALAEATGRNEAQIKLEYKECGDLGLVAKASRTTQRTMFTPQPLTCAKLLEAFRFIAKESGSQSNEKKRGRMKQLIVAARGNEPQFIVRLLQGKMRIGLAEQTVLAALAQAAALQSTPPIKKKDMAAKLEEAVAMMKQAYSVLPVYDRIISVILTGGVWGLGDACRFTLGVPVGPMLAKPTRGISEVLDKFQNSVFTCEYKYDGERAQIHYLEDGSVEIYSRNAERNTQKFPDLVSGMQNYMEADTKSFVLDAEVVAYDRETDKILPFQVLSTRARKGVIMGDIKVQVCLFAFDLLYINGRELLQEQLCTRRELLYSSFKEVKGRFQFATAITTRDVDEMQLFLNQAVNDSCEGCMVKTLEQDATYEPAKRSNKWLKLKKDYMDNLGDSLDLVPVGAFHGRGKRAGVFGAFLLACYDESTEEYQSICKIGTGFSEAILEQLSSSLRESVIDSPPTYYRCNDSLGVDVWFSPCQVWEVKAADLSISPVHLAANGRVDPVKGIALRFPRFLRLRDDKNPEQATTAEQVSEMYLAQKINHQTVEEEIE